MSSNPNLSAIEDLIEQGFAIFPLQPGSKVPMPGWNWKTRKLGIDDHLAAYTDFAMKLEPWMVVIDVDDPDKWPGDGGKVFTAFQDTTRGFHLIYSYYGDHTNIASHKQPWGDLLRGVRYIKIHNTEYLVDEAIEPLPDRFLVKERSGFVVNTLSADQVDPNSATRNNDLAAYAGLLVENGMALEAVKAAISRVNDKFTTPLDLKEISRTIWKTLPKWIAAYDAKPAKPAAPIPGAVPLTDIICTLDFADMDIEPLNYIVPGVALGSSMLITGQSGLGKSIYALDTFLAVAKARPDLEWLIIDSEMTPRTVRDRIGNAGLANLFYKFIDQDPNVWSYDYSRFAGVAIDTISGAMVTKLAENDAEYWRPVNEWVRRLMRNDQFACCTHHEGKEARYGGRGNSASQSMFELVVSITGNMEQVKIKVSKNRHGIDFQTGEIEIKWDIKEARPKHSYVI